MTEFNYIVNLCYLLNGQGEILLQHKRQGFGQGKWNGPGGKIRPGETVDQSVVREVKEETGLTLKNCKKMGELEFIFKKRSEWNNYCHVFVSKDFFGKLTASKEGELKWFKIADIPYGLMWEDDKHWLPEVLAGKQVKMRFNFNRNGKLIDYEKI